MEEQQYDLVIIGGGLAGASIASVMARNGASVLVLEKERTFKDRVRGEFLAPWGLADVRALGLLDTLTGAGAVPLPALAGRSLKPRPVLTPDGEPPLSFTHTEVQEALLGEARQAGATVIRGATVTSVQSEPGGYTHYRTAEGPGRATARLTVGADGRTSLARKALGREEMSRETERVLAGVLLENVPLDTSFGYFVIREDVGGLVSLFPQAHGRARAYVFMRDNVAGAYTGKDGYQNFMADMVRLGVPAEALEGATKAGPLGAFVATDSWVMDPASDVLALVGDAAGISDPTWGQGMALAFHDARTLTTELLSTIDWPHAARRYAAQRDDYFARIITIEGWLTELQLSGGEAAAARRAHVMRAWKQDPGRGAAVDINGLGPALQATEEVRRFVFAEDVAAEPHVRSDEEVARDFLRSIREQDFVAMRGLLKPTGRTRGLLSGGPIELHGAEDTARAFARWYGDVEEMEPLETSFRPMADRMQMSWRCRIRWAGEDFYRVIEQTAYAKVAEGQIAVMDLVCSGFRPEVATAA